MLQKQMPSLAHLSLQRDVIWARAFMRALREAEETEDQERLRGLGVIWEPASSPAERAALAGCWRAGESR